MFSLVALSSFLALLRTIVADVTFNDLPGLYDAASQGLPFCGQVLNIQLSGNRISSMKFDGVEQCFTTDITLQQKRLDASSNDSAIWGAFLLSGTIRCQRSIYVTMELFNTTESIAWTALGFADPFEFRPGIKYVLFVESNKGSCIYRQRGASSNQASDSRKDGGAGGRGGGGGGSSSSRSSGDGANGGKVRSSERGSNIKPAWGGGGGDPVIWVWLVPVIGTVATITVALITEYCVRRRELPGKNDDVRSVSATGIAGGIYFNIGEQGGHSQRQTHHDSSPTAWLSLNNKAVSPEKGRLVWREHQTDIQSYTTINSDVSGLKSGAKQVQGIRHVTIHVAG